MFVSFRGPPGPAGTRCGHRPVRRDTSAGLRIYGRRRCLSERLSDVRFLPCLL